MIDVVRGDKVETTPTATRTTTRKERCLTTEKDDIVLPQLITHKNHTVDPWTISSNFSSSSTLDADNDVDKGEIALDVTVSDDGINRGGQMDSLLTVEDLYFEAMTLEAEVRVFRRSLDAAGRRELSQIIDFCRHALRRKLLLQSLEHGPRSGLHGGSSYNNSVRAGVGGISSTPDVDKEVAVDASMSDTMSVESTGKELTSPASTSGHNQRLSVPELVDSGRQNSLLTVEDLYVEAMTLDADIRVFGRRLDAAGRRELSQIIDFCRQALHRKLLLRSLKHA